MDINSYEEHRRDLLYHSHTIEKAKRPGYTSADNDVLKNFKHVAQRLGITPMQAWGVYFLKHIDAISSYAKDKDIPQAEELTGRFADAVNYLSLGYALYKEQQGLDLVRVVDTVKDHELADHMPDAEKPADWKPPQWKNPPAPIKEADAGF